VDIAEENKIVAISELLLPLMPPPEPEPDAITATYRHISALPSKVSSEVSAGLGAISSATIVCLSVAGAGIHGAGSSAKSGLAFAGDKAGSASTSAVSGAAGVQSNASSFLGKAAVVTGVVVACEKLHWFAERIG